jgi:hypothetical protein
MIMKKRRLMIVLPLLLVLTIAEAHRPPEHAKVFFAGMEDVAVVKNPFRLARGLKKVRCCVLQPAWNEPVNTRWWKPLFVVPKSKVSNWPPQITSNQLPVEA